MTKCKSYRRYSSDGANNGGSLTQKLWDILDIMVLIETGDSSVNKEVKAIVLTAGNLICAAIATAIVFYAIRTWPTRYGNHTLSWSVTGFFVLFVVLSVLGSVAAIIYLRGARSPLFFKLATAPISLLGLGVLIGLAKAAMTNDL